MLYVHVCVCVCVCVSYNLVGACYMCVYVYVYMCVYTCIIYNLIGVCGAQQSTHTPFDRRLARTPVQRTKILVPSATRVCVCVCV